MLQKKILIAANPELGARLKDSLQDLAQIYTVDNGVDALSFCQRNPDTFLFIIDMDLNTVDGYEFLAVMRLSPYLEHVPVIALSEDDSREERRRVLRLGATEFVPKPFQMVLFRHRVSFLLQQEENTAPPKHLPGSFAHQMYNLSQSILCGLCVFALEDDYSVSVVFFNKQHANICGYKHYEYAELVEHNISLETTIHPDDFLIFRQAIETLITDRQPVYQTLRIMKKDGSITTVSFNAKVYGEVHGSLVFHAVTLDLSDSEAAARSHSLDSLQNGREYFDPLTQILNADGFAIVTRKMLDEHPDGGFTLIIWDIDRFKVVNDLFGRKTGDSILKQIGAHLRKTTLGLGTFGRIGPDSFAFCLQDRHFNLELMLKEQTSLCNSLPIHYNLTMHAGIYQISDTKLDINSMCDRARMALSTVKGNYVLRYAFYKEEMRSSVLAEQQLLSDMHHALDGGEFIIYLQPIYGLAVDRPVSAEVLVRWRHPRLGVLAPDQFLPLFERNRFISQVDMNTWELTCRYLAQRRARGLTDMPLSVNVSRANLLSPDLVTDLNALIEKYQLNKSLLKLEISESAYMENPQQLLTAAQTLRNAGFTLMIDDFGSGHSSLKLLQEMSADALKLDMLFVRNSNATPRNAAIISGLIKIAQQLNMVTIAEGVETKEQFDFLRSIGCDNIQGYYYARPMPTAEFDKLMEQPITLL